MALTNTSKPSSPSYTNSTKPSFAELWSTITTTWASETRTWADCASLFDNVSRPSTSLANTSRPTILADSYAETNGNSSWATYSPYTIESQSFTAISGVLDSCKFYLYKFGSPTGNITAALYAHTGTYGTSSTPTGSALATSSTYLAQDLTTTPTLITFTFSGSNRVTLVPGTKYCLTYSFSGGNSSNRIETLLDTTSPTHSGNLAEWNSGTWDLYPSDDLPFYLYLA